MMRALPGIAFAAAALAQDIGFFEKHVRPVLAANCYSCHSAAARTPFAGLRLDSREAMLRGGDRGPAIVPGNPAGSRLVQAVRHVGVRMPPTGKLTGPEIAAIEQWIAAGAPWPAAQAAPAVAGEDVARRNPDHWAWQPPMTGKAATIDTLQPAGSPASRRTLIRRAYLDLLGLPPTFEQIQRFERDPSPRAWETLIDTLLASPHFGERWARHWLDLARYADAGVRSVRFAFAHSYRDWVIDALNRDMPYSRFVQLQIAADQIPGARQQDLAALGFLTLGLNPVRRTDLAEKIDDRIDVVTRGILGLTVSCARCHDHKYDPIPTRDYYSLYGVFLNSDEPFQPPLISGSVPGFYARSLTHRRQALDNYLATRLEEMKADFRKPETSERYQATARESKGMTNPQVDNLAKERNLNLYVLRRWRAKILDGRDLDPTDVPLADYWQIATEGDFNTMSDLTWRHQTLLSEFAHRTRAAGAMTLADSTRVEPAHVFVRGNKEDAGEQVPRQFLAVLSKGGQRPFTRGSGRLELALSVTAPDNPLTARVMANRVWQRLMGEGIVATPSDFGVRGDPPVNRALLDLLAVRFAEDGWSVKKLIRRAMLSRAYQQASRPARRLDFESMRDSMLAVSGRLSAEIGGPSFALGAVPADPRRSLYAFVERQKSEAVLKSFDFSDPEAHTPKRFSTTVPQQALFLMNSPFIAEQARNLAAGAASSDPAERIEILYRRVLARRPTKDETALARRFVDVRPAPASGPLASPWRYGWGKLDPDAGRLTAFEPFAYFTEDTWQAASLLPDSRAGMASLAAGGGHPGDGLSNAVVRRWVAPTGGLVIISGAVGHAMNQFEERFNFGNGIRAWILHSGSGIIGQWDLRNAKAEARAVLDVQAGEWIDFVVDSKDDYDSDRFTWAPVISMAGAVWSAKADFRGPQPRPLNGWEQLAQVLLLTNEFAFVD
ncbi:MAG: DUF1553 domain-containing protein [Acidobacteria bacterium]|nr:DUF1553 domain-containing protein [Acidobacteriota bacterium]